MTKVTLQNTHISVEINTKGAEILQFRNLYKLQEVLWKMDLQYWNRTAPLLFPIVGKLKNDVYSHQGQTFIMRQHGFARDAEFEILDCGETFLQLRLNSSTQTRLQYPFDFQLDVKYSLQDQKLIAENKITNLGPSPMPVSFGAHPGFLIDLPIDTCKIIIHRNKEFDLSASEIIQRHLISEGLYTGKSEDLKVTRSEIHLNEDYFNTDAIVFKNEGITGMSLFQNEQLIARLDAPDAPYWGIWKKPGAPFICIEPWWGLADQIESSNDLFQKEGIHLLRNNDTWITFYTIHT